jgi:hypothetical protein
VRYRRASSHGDHVTSEGSPKLANGALAGITSFHARPLLRLAEQLAELHEECSGESPLSLETLYTVETREHRTDFFHPVDGSRATVTEGQRFSGESVSLRLGS